MCEKKKEAHAERDLVVHYGIFLKKHFFFLDAMSLDPVALVRECAESDGSRRTNVFLAFKRTSDLEELLKRGGEEGVLLS